jgi:hypothetical protein
MVPAMISINIESKWPLWLVKVLWEKSAKAEALWIIILEPFKIQRRVPREATEIQVPSI